MSRKLHESGPEELLRELANQQFPTLPEDASGERRERLVRRNSL